MFLQGLYSGITAGFSTGILKMTKLFPVTGNFKVDFINNLALWTPGAKPISIGAGSIGAALTAWFSYYGFPNANTIRNYQRGLKNEN